MNQILNSIYGNKTRIRVCGILAKNDRVLMVNHSGLNNENIFWNFPGGGVEPYENIEQALRREYLEETHLEIEIKKLCYINQVIIDSLHAIEFYFHVQSSNFNYLLGNDPEHNILSEAKWIDWQNLMKLKTHHCPVFLRNFESIESLLLNKNYLNLLNGAINENF